MSEPAGALWCARYPTSRRVEDLAHPFQGAVGAFVDALVDAGATVVISATYRPPEGAYLMDFACLIAGYGDERRVFHQISPRDIPPMKGVDIDWTWGGDPGAARSAAVAMVRGYEIEFPAALVSNHTRRLAVDMTIHFQGPIKVRTGTGEGASVSTQSDLWPVGAAYGVQSCGATRLTGPSPAIR